MAKKVKVVFKEEIKSVTVGDVELNIFWAEKGTVEDLFKAVKGWRGLAIEIRKKATFLDLEFDFEFEGSEEDKLIFEKKLKELGFFHGLGYNINLEEEINYNEILPYIKAENYKDAETRFVLGKYFSQFNDTSEISEHWLKEAAGQGYAPAQYELGKEYYRLSAFKPDSKDLAFDLIRMAAEQNYAPALLEMAIIYDPDFETPMPPDSKSYDLAFEYYKKAADIGYLDGQNRFISFCDRNYNNTLFNNNTLVKLILADCYVDGRYAGPAFNKAMTARIRVLKEGFDPKAYDTLDDEMRKSYIDLVSFAAVAGYACGQYELGKLCKFNAYVLQKRNDFITSKQCFKAAAEWFGRAAVQGNPKAQYEYGLCFLYGKGVGKNKDEAKKWLEIAYKQGIEAADPIAHGFLPDGTFCGFTDEEAAEDIYDYDLYERKQNSEHEAPEENS